MKKAKSDYLDIVGQLDLSKPALPVDFHQGGGA
jgi:hypothetical protein